MLTIALPKDTLLKDSIQLFQAAKLDFIIKFSSKIAPSSNLW